MSLSNLVALFSSSLSADESIRKECEQKLEIFSSSQEYHIGIFQLLGGPSVDVTVKKSACIHLKNQISKRWPIDHSCGGISMEARDVMRNGIVELLLMCHESLVPHLQEAVRIIGEDDFPTNWSSLLPALCTKLSNCQELQIQQRILSVLSALLIKYKTVSRSDETLKELTEILPMIQQIHLDQCKSQFSRLSSFLSFIGNDINTEIQGVDYSLFPIVMDIIKNILDIYISMSSVDIPEHYEDNIDTWFTVFCRLLSSELNPRVFSNKEAVITYKPLLYEMNVQVVTCCNLYVEKYEDKIINHVQGIVQSAWSVLVAISSRTHEKAEEEEDERFISITMSLLASCAKKPWIDENGVNKSPFQSTDALREIFSVIIVRNIELTSSDMEMFGDNPMEFVRQNMESAEHFTKRRASLDLLHSLCSRFQDRVTPIAKNYIQSIFNGQNGWRSIEGASRILTGCAIKSQTSILGALELNPDIDVRSFFSAVLLPHLKISPLPSDFNTEENLSCIILKCSALQFISNFRLHIISGNSESVFIEEATGLIKIVVEHLQTQSVVLQNYAAFAFTALLSTIFDGKDHKIKQLSKPCDLNPILFSVAIPACRIIVTLMDHNRNISIYSEYLGRCLNKILFTFISICCSDSTGQPPIGSDYLNNLSNMSFELIPHLLGIIAPIASRKICINPLFPHQIFEAIGCCMNISLRLSTGSTSLQNTEESRRILSRVKDSVLPVFGSILQENSEDFVLYVLQLMGILLSNLHSLTDSDQNLFDNLLHSILSDSLWENTGNVPALIFLLTCYFEKHLLFQLRLKETMSLLVAKFHKILYHRRMEIKSLSIIISLFQNVPLVIYRDQLSDILRIILQRIHARNTTQMRMAFAYLISVFIVESVVTPHNSIEIIRASLQGIQEGLFKNIMEGIVLPTMASGGFKGERRLTSIKCLSKLCHENLNLDPKLVIQAAVGLVNSGSVITENTKSTITPEEIPEEYETTFSALRSAIINRQRPIQKGDPTVELKECITMMYKGHLQIDPQMATLFAPK